MNDNVQKAGLQLSAADIHVMFETLLYIYSPPAVFCLAFNPILFSVIFLHILIVWQQDRAKS